MGYKNKLIKLGEDHKDLRPHIRSILTHLKTAGSHTHFEGFVRDQIIKSLAKEFERSGYMVDSRTWSLSLRHKNERDEVKWLKFKCEPALLYGDTVAVKMTCINEEHGQEISEETSTSPKELHKWAMDMNRKFASEMVSQRN